VDMTANAADVAIIGMACRFPAAKSLDALWENLLGGVDGLTVVPSERWNADNLTDEDGLTPGAMRTRMGGFIPGVDAFDAAFFGVSALEAASMDPQQRLVLQTTWHALEDAAIPAGSLARSKTGVFLGAAPSDYASMAFQSPELLNSTSPTGAAVCMVANRVSQMLDVRGPSMVFDTGCSSSLVAADRACSALISGEVSLALAGGVSLMLTPEPSIAISSAWMLSSSGKCRSFDEAADGYVRGEGCGVVVLKRYADAVRDGNRIWARIRGSAINHGGRGPSVTNPSLTGLTEVIVEAMRSANIHSKDIGYIECHGVASPSADATEIAALQAALPEARCAIGSIKSNIGHLEWAAGIAALIKAVLCVHHRAIPPNLHFDRFAPDVVSNGFHVPTILEAWPEGRRSIAAINTFGLGGANAHMVIEGPSGPSDMDTSAPASEANHSRSILPVSARSERALLELESEYRKAPVPGRNACYTAAVGRDHHRFRLAMFANSQTARLSEPVSQSRTVPGPLRIAMAFTGQGAQRKGMGLDLLTNPVFRETFERCDAVLAPLLGRNLADVLNDDIIHQTRFAQAGLFAFQVSLAALWNSWGVRPDLVLGHSVGEIAAAQVCGMLSLEDAARLVAERGRLMGSLPENTGSMLAVFASPEDVTPFLSSSLEIAAFNGPEMTVVSGLSQDVADLATRLEEEFVTCAPLRVSHAFHSFLMEPILEPFGLYVEPLSHRTGHGPMISTLTGALLDSSTVLTADYWTRQLRSPVRFLEATRYLDGYTVLEIGPGNTLSRFGERCRPDLKWIPSILKADSPEPLLEGLGALYESGADIQWSAVYASPARIVRIPSYPFSPDRHWLERAAPAQQTDVRKLIESTLGAILTGPISESGGFFDHGMDSRGALELASRLGKALQRSVPVSMIFANPTLEELTGALGGTPIVAAVPEQKNSLDPIAVVGWSCRLPGGVHCPDDLWRLLLAGTDATGPISAERLAGLDDATRQALTGRRAAFLADVDAWEPEAFGISPREARAIDPQHLLLLELAWEAMENAGLARRDLEGSLTGVFVGVIELENSRTTLGAEDLVYTLLGNLGSAAAGRISHLFGLRGPSMAIDTACSSSLVSIHLACQSLRSGECDRALAGGVNLMLDPTTFLALDQAGALSKDGSCKTFDASADGYGRGEGGGLLMLRRYSDAVAAGENILAVIHGSAVNHDGRAAGFTVPNGRAQEIVLRAAMRQAGANAEDVGYVEAHGTGTSLGDPIEVDAIGRVLGPGRSSPLLLGSLKTNIGHLEAAAGVAGFIKAALCLERQSIPPHLHLRNINPHLRLEAIPARVPTATAPWPAGSKFAGISSFGMSGTNAHIIVGRGPRQLPLSARPRTWNRRRLRSEVVPAAGISAKTANTDSWLYEVIWKPVERVTGGGHPRYWIVADRVEDADPVAAILRDRKIEVGVALGSKEAPADAVVIWMCKPTWNFAQLLGVAARALNQILVTRSGVPVGSEDVDPLASALWGFGRSLANERAGRCRLLDVGTDVSPQTVADALMSSYPQLALRGTEWYAPQLVPRRKRPVAPGSAVRLESSKPGYLSELHWREIPRRAPGLDEIEVRVELLLTNFRDAVRVLALAGNLKTPLPLGIEWIGVVESSGEGVTRLKPGDRVVGLAPAGVASYVTVDQNLACVLPESLACEDAAAVPLNYTLAWYALMEIARARPGERVLIHSGASALGLAAIEIARHAGVEIVATAGTRARREFLRERGVSTVYDSRTLDFAEKLQASGGVDIILNSIAGAGANHNLRLLRPGGRLIEIGQRGGVTETPPRNTGVFHVDLLEFALSQPQEFQRIMTHVMEFLGRKEHRAIPLQVFPSTQAHDAIRSLARAVQVGKVAVKFDGVAEEVFPSICATLEPVSGTVLVTGGIGGLGRRVVERLCLRNFRHIAIVSRRTPDAETMQWIQKLSADIRVFRGDVGEVEDVDRILAEIRATLPPLAGVVHAAGILDDGLIESQTGARFEAVLKGKARGAWNLHERIHEPLKFFALFSSVASVLGTVGQTPYAAANGFLDGLAARRRFLGLPATSIEWGPWAEVGMAAALADSAVRAMAPAQALDVFEQLVVHGTTPMAVIDTDWPRLAVELSSLQTLMPGIEMLRSGADLNSAEAATSEILRCASEVLGASTMHASPRDMGMDSIMAVQLSQRLQRVLRVSVPAAQILEAESVEAFVALALKPLRLDRSVEAPVEAPRLPQRNPWLHTIRRSGERRIKLFCFPFAGVGATTFRKWEFGGAIEAHGVELPGRGSLANEPVARVMESLIPRLLQGLLPELDGPFAFFGHCMGGLVAFELTRALRSVGKAPQHLFISACPPPDRYAVAQFDPRTLRYVSDPPERYDGLLNLQDLAPSRFMEVLQFLDFGPARQVLEDDELMQRALPVAQADFGVCANYRWNPEPPLAVPITTFVGREDPFFDMELPGGVRFTIEEWQRQTTASFETIQRDGDHYYLMEDRPYLQRAIAERL
jgi:acyl transferase domain-containing protein/NADPH:quinone reductase-like Zn-dependent oxidoreductase/surfactin synthase thioesterase subunit/NAD(P)-dependent dehydrogenase (short-subunit alcohol dehydrogenase family)